MNSCRPARPARSAWPAPSSRHRRPSTLVPVSLAVGRDHSSSAFFRLAAANTSTSLSAARASDTAAVAPAASATKAQNATKQVAARDLPECEHQVPPVPVAIPAPIQRIPPAAKRSVRRSSAAVTRPRRSILHTLPKSNKFGLRGCSCHHIRSRACGSWSRSWKPIMTSQNLGEER